MMSLRRYALLACLLPFPVMASQFQDPDVYAAIVRQRVESSGSAAAFSGSTAALLKDLLVTPESPFSDLAAQPEMTNAIWWAEMSENLFPRSTDPTARALDALRMQMGVTKARPGVEYQVDAHLAARYRGTYAAAQAMKAGVDADIFWQALTLNGAKSAEAAGEAVALQILRDQMRRNDPSTYLQKTIQPEVLKRYMRQENSLGVSDQDRHYLGAVLRGALSPRSPSFASGGLPSGLPTIYRVARVAAAYSDASGYVGGPTCSDANPDIPEPGEPFCFAAATDRAVRSWYRRELLWQQVRHARNQQESLFDKAVHWLAPVLFLLDGVAFIEFAEGAIASDLLAGESITEEEALLASERTENITCRIHE